MLKYYHVCLLCACLILSTPFWSQSPGRGQTPANVVAKQDREGNGKPERHLIRVQTIQSSSENATEFVPPLTCDSDGDIYFQTDPGAPAIHKVNPKGERVALFQATSNPNLKIDYSRYFAVSQEGEVDELVFPHEINRYVFVYSPDGTLKSTIKLQPGFAWMPKVLTAFPGGNFLIVGEEYDQDPSAAMWPFTGIFATDGTLLKEIKLPDDGTLRKMASDGHTRVTVPQVPSANRAVDLSRVEMASDGNAYVMRWTNPAVFYAISPGGEVVRRFTVDPGNGGYRPAAMHVTKDRIAVLFYDPQTNDKIMRVVDLEGHTMATYDELRANGKPVGDPIGTAFACYTQSPERFTFVGSQGGNFQLWIAEAR